MKDYVKTFVREETPLLDAIKLISGGESQIALVVDEERRLLGTITDADLRNFILRGEAFDVPCGKAMQRSPISLPLSSSPQKCLALMKSRHIRQLPLLDEAGAVRGMVLLEELIADKTLPNAVVVMAGGLGSRLGGMTRNCPKPMLTVGEKPLLESIVERLTQQGFHRFYFAVNYLADTIIRYFDDGSQWDASIDYLKEEEALGTAGALSLLPENEIEPVLVMNGDILTLLDLAVMLDFHRQKRAVATMAVKKYAIQVPYGVIDISEESFVERITEKPSYEHHINAGIYVLNPEVVHGLPKARRLDMPEVFETLRRAGAGIAAYPIHELWVDIGTPEDFAIAEKACRTNAL